MRRRTRNILLVLLSMFVLLIGAVALAPYWTGLLLPRVLARYTIGYGSYERDGYAHFVLHGVTYSRNGTTFRAREVKGLTPLVWLFKRSGAFLDANDWTLDFTATNAPAKTNTFYSSVEQARSKIKPLGEWLPRVALHDGIIDASGQRIPVLEALWANGNLSAAVSLPRFNEAVRVDAKLGTNFPWVATVVAQSNNVRVDLVLTNATSLSGTILWRTNRADFAAEFGETGVWPVRGSINAPAIRIPAAEVNLPGYNDVNGTLAGLWRDGQFNLNLHASAEPAKTGTNAQPVTALIEVTGTTNAATVETFSLAMPWLSARLSAPLSLSFKGEMLTRTTAFSVQADLDKQRVLPIHGQVSGQATLRRRAGQFPAATFRVSGNHVSGFDLEAAQLNAEGQLAWPTLDVTALQVAFANGSTATIATGVDLEKQIVHHGNIRFAGKIAENLVPFGYDYDRLQLHANFDGPFKALNHSGELTVDEVVVPYVKTFGASAKWEGTVADLKHFETEMRVSNSASLMLGGAMNLVRAGSTNLINANISKLNITGGRQSVTLKNGASFSADLVRTARTNRWSARVSPMDFGNISVDGKVDWLTAGRFSIRAKQIDSEMVNAFLIRPLAKVHFDELAAAATWNSGPANWNFNTVAHVVPKHVLLDKTPGATTAIERDFLEIPISVRVRLSGDDHQLALQNVTLGTDTETVVSASGSVPLTIEPARVIRGASNLIQLRDNEPIQLRAAMGTNIAFWDSITRNLPLKLHSPMVNLNVTGTLSDPYGTLHCEIPAANWSLFTNTVHLGLADLKADATLSRREIHLTKLAALIEGQPLVATATLPLPDNLQRNWRKIFDWRTATANVRADDVEIAPFAELQPKFISPEGTLWANATIERGKLTGSITVSNAATKPLAQFGSLRDIEARIKFSDKRITIERCSGNVGSGPVAVFGWADLSRINSVTKLPVFDLNLRGDSVPVARRANLIVRTGFDLFVSNTNGEPAVITGAVNLQNSYVLSDVRVLVPHVARPDLRPPYFSITTKPYSDWKLNVKIKGDHFMKVRSPFFNGECSADLHLAGTLAEPVSLGDVTINSGEVDFPFANVKITQGIVALTASHPYMPHLYVTGTTKAYDYDVRMMVTGPVDNPNIEFTSTPALGSEQILAMLTTGEMPATATALTAQQRATRVGGFVGKSILSRLGIAGGEQRLTIRSGRDVSEQNTETYSAQYKLNPDWSIIGDYNRFGGLNLGLKWRFYSK